MVLSENGINWVWYCEGDRNPKYGFWIHKLYRIHKGEVGHPQSEGRFILKENEKREAIGIYIDDELVPVANPKYLFKYMPD